MDIYDPQSMMTEAFSAARDPSRTALERVWWRNILMDTGEQWLEWMDRIGMYVRPGHMTFMEPTPVSNILREAKGSVRALFLNKDYETRIWPNSNDQTDKDAARLGEDLLRWMDAKRDSEIDDEIEMCSDIVAVLGTGFLRTFPGKPGGHWVIGKDGTIEDGAEVMVESVLPFSVHVDNLGWRLRDKRWIGIRTMRPREWVEDTFKVKVSSEAAGEVVDFERRLAHQVATVSPWKGRGIQFAAPKDSDIVMFKEIEYRPCPKFPSGRYVVGAGSQVIEQYDGMPVPVGDDGKWFYSIVDFHYHRVIGRFWSDPAIADLIGPQRQINQIDQSLEISRKGLARPMILTAKGAEIARKNSGSLAFMHIEWDPQQSQFAKPEIKYGTPLPAQVFNERELHMRTAQDASGDPRNILRGQTPTSSASGVMVDILRDAAEQGHKPNIDRFYRALRRVHRQRLILAQEIYPEGTMMKVPGAGHEVYVRAFAGADLRGNTDVRLELASGLSTTSYGKTQVLQGLAEKGMFGDLSQNPRMRSALLKKMGLSDRDFDDEFSTDFTRAEWENSLVANAVNMDEARTIPQEALSDYIEGRFIWLEVAGDQKGLVVPWIDGLYVVHIYPDDPVYGENAGREVNIIPTNTNFPKGKAAHLFRLDNHEIHHETHRRFILSKEFEQLHPICQRLMLLHDEIHQMKIREAQHQQALAAEADGLRQRSGTQLSSGAISVPPMTSAMQQRENEAALQ